MEGAEQSVPTDLTLGGPVHISNQVFSQRGQVWVSHLF